MNEDLSESTDRVLRRLERASATPPGRSGTLASLALIGASGYAFAVSMLVDGRLVTGVVAPPGEFVRSADRAFGRAADAFGWDLEALKPDGAAGPFEMFDAARVAAKERRQDTQDRYFGALGDDEKLRIDDIAVEDIADIYGDEAWISISQATLTVDGQSVRVGSLSVRLSDISAWWPTDELEGSNVTYGESA